MARWLAWLGVGLLGAALPVAAGGLPPQMVVLRVAVDAAGHVREMTPADARTPPPLLEAAEAYGRKLAFQPARKAGQAVPSETHLSVLLAARPLDDGRFTVKLERAINAPGVAALGRLVPPRVPKADRDATVVVQVTIDPDGVPDAASLQTVAVHRRDDSVDPAPFVEAVRKSLVGTRFIPDRVNGVAVASRVTLPYRFGQGGPVARAAGDAGPNAGSAGKDGDAPVMTAESLDPTVQLAKIDYTASTP